MKKLLFVFVSVFTLMLSGCGTQNESTNGFRNTDDTSENSETTENTTPEESTSESSTEEASENNGDAETIMVDESKDSIADESKDSSVAAADNTPLKITSFNGGMLETDQAYNVVRGTTPKNTYSIVVNGYKLQKYYPGQTAWSYIAGEKYKTLKAGKNDYTVKALDKSGKEIASTNFSISYTEIDEHKLPNVGNSGWLSLLLALSIMTSYLITRQKKLL